MTKRMAGRIDGHRTSPVEAGRDHHLSSAETLQALPRTARFRSHDDEDDEETAEVDRGDSRR
jgi:hypothetical protein